MSPSDNKIKILKENKDQLSIIKYPKQVPQVPKKPSFQKLRFELQSINQQKDPSSIKEQFKPDLKRLSLGELKNLLNKQEKIVRNKKLLDNLKDKGTKAKKFFEEIQKEFKIRNENIDKNIIKTNNLLEELTIKEEIKDEENDEIKIVSKKQSNKSPYKDLYSENREHFFNKSTLNKRFNQPANVETIMNKQRSVKTLNYKESFENLEKTNKIEKESLREKMIRFYEYRTRDDDDNDDDESEQSENYDNDDNDNDCIRVNLIDYSI